MFMLQHWLESVDLVMKTVFFFFLNHSDEQQMGEVIHH